MRFCKHCNQFITRIPLKGIINPLVKKIITEMGKRDLSVDEMSNILKVNKRTLYRWLTGQQVNIRRAQKEIIEKGFPE